MQGTSTATAVGATGGATNAGGAGYNPIDTNERVGLVSAYRGTGQAQGQQKAMNMTIALKKGVLLLKGIRDDPELTIDEISNELRSCIQRRDKDEHVVHFLRVLNCRRDIFAIIMNVIEEIPTMFSITSLVAKDSVFAGKELKRLLFAMRQSLSRISIQECRVNDYANRGMCLEEVFIFSDTRPKRMPKLENLSISLVPLTIEDVTANDNYSKRKGEIDVEMRMHSVMNGNYFSNGIDLETKYMLRQLMITHEKEKVVIDQRSLFEPVQFKDLIERLATSSKEVHTVIFLNVGQVENRTFAQVLKCLRTIESLKSVAFVRFQANQIALDLIKNFLFWRKNSLEDILFITCSLHEGDLKYLFGKKDSNLTIKDFSKLHRLIVADNPQVSQNALKELIGELDDWKAERVSSAIVKLGEPFSLKEKYLAKDQYQLRRNPEIHTKLNVFKSSNERFLTDYHFKNFSCSSLELDGFHLDTASKPFLGQLLTLIRSSKSLVHLSLRDTNLSGITMPFRQANERIEGLIESIDLSENSFEQKQQLLSVFSHVNVANLKQFRLSKCTLYNKDFEDLLGVLHLCKNMRLFDLSHTKGVSADILWGAITRLLYIEELNLRNCQIQADHLATVNALLYDHLKKIKDPSEEQQMAEPLLFLPPVLSELHTLDLSENDDLLTSLVDFLIYAILSSNNHLSNISLSAMNLTSDQVAQLLKAVQERRITGLTSLDLSGNPLNNVSSVILSTLLMSLIRENRRTLTRLNLAKTNLTQEQLGKIENELIVKHRMSTYIEEFDISENTSIPISGFMRFYASAIRANVRHVNWTNSNLSGVRDASEFSTVIKAMPLLESLDISRNQNLSERAISSIVSSVSESPHLKRFTAKHMNWSSSQFAAFVDALMGRINTANSRNTIDNEIAEDMAFKHLETLDLTGNYLLDQDAYQWQRFFHVIFANGAFRKLENLILCDVRFNDEIAKKFSDAIFATERVAGVKQSLKSIDVSNSAACYEYSWMMSDNGYNVFIKALEKMKSLRRLGLRRTGLNSAKIACLCELVFANQLEMIDISGSESSMNFIDEQDYSSNLATSQSLVNLFGCIDGSFSQERLAELLRVQAMREDPRRVFDVMNDSEEFKRVMNTFEDRIVEVNMSENADLSHRSFRSVLQAVNSLGPAKIRSVLMDHCALDVMKTATLVRFLEQAVSGLVKLSVAHNKFGSENSVNARLLLQVVQRKYANTIEELNIAYTNFDEQNLLLLSATIADHFLNLKVFNCSGLHGASPKGLETLLTGLTLAAQGSLHTLIMQDLQITEPKQELLIEMFTYNMFTKIIRIDLSNNQFLQPSFETFIRSLSVSCGPGLRELIMRSCKLTGESIRHLSKRFYGAGFTALECLDISGNEVIGPSSTNESGIEAIIEPNDLGELISKISEINCRNFKVLRLQSMNLKDVYIHCLRKVIERINFDSLTCLDISGNATTPLGSAVEVEPSAMAGSILSEYSLLPFFEMIHFKFGKSYKSLVLSDMNIEGNPRMLSSIDHIVLKFRIIDAFIMPYSLETLRHEQTTLGSSEFRQLHLSRQHLFMELIETISRQIVFLDLSGQQLTDKALYSIRDMHNLEYLDLSHNTLMSESTIQNLVNCPRISTLKVVQINSEEPVINALIAYIRGAPLHVRVSVNYQIVGSAVLRKALLETVLQQPIYKKLLSAFEKGHVIGVARGKFSENYLLKLAEDDDDSEVMLRFAELPKVDVGMTNEVLHRILESKKAWIRLDLAMASRNRGQLESLHCVVPEENIDFSDAAEKMRQHVKSGTLFLTVAYVQKFLKIFPVQTTPEEQLRFFLSERFFKICQAAGVKQIIVDHPNYMIQPEYYSKNDINLIMAAAKKYGILKIYMDYHLEIESKESQRWINEVLAIIPPSGMHFHPNTLPLEFITNMHKSLQNHPYFKYCDMNAVEIEDLSDKLAVVYRERCYKFPTPPNRLSGLNEWARRSIFGFFDWVDRKLYIEGVEGNENAPVPLGILIGWFLVMAFCVCVQQILFDEFYLTMIIIFSFMFCHYLLEFFLHYKSMKASRESFQYIDEILWNRVLVSNCFKYLLSSLCTWKVFSDYFLVRLYLEAKSTIVGYFLLGWVSVAQLLYAGFSMMSKFRQPGIVQFEILAILFEQLHVRVVAAGGGISTKSAAVYLKIFSDIIPCMLFYLVFFSVSKEYKHMAVQGFFIQFAVLVYQLVLLTAIAPNQTSQIEFDQLSNTKGKEIEQQRNLFVSMYNNESLRSLDAVQCKRILPVKPANIQPIAPGNNQPNKQ